MLITFSGVVGSGKSTAARHTLDILGGSGLSAKYLRFQSLSSFNRPRRPRGLRPAWSSTPFTPEGDQASMRGYGYRRRKLTLSRTLAYMARAIIFRVFRLRFDSQTCLVVNRYFYDNLAHYQLKTRVERIYISLLRLIIPAPDLPLVLFASLEATAERRSNYAHAYLGEVRAGYENLRQYFPELIVISSEGRIGMEESLTKALCARLALDV
jgi:thymidylate kinase